MTGPKLISQDLIKNPSTNYLQMRSRPLAQPKAILAGPGNLPKVARDTPLLRFRHANQSTSLSDLEAKTARTLEQLAIMPSSDTQLPRSAMTMQ